MLLITSPQLISRKQTAAANIKNHLILLLLLWIIVQFVIYLQTGIKPILESLKYINAAEQLIATGTLPGVRYLFYLSTTLVIALSLKLKLGFAGVIFFQLLINFWATLQFFRSLTKIQNNPYAALITTSLLIICIPYQTWNFYLYTESLFYSFTLLFFAACLNKENLTSKLIIKQLTLLLLAIISRPLGILLFPCWLLYLIVKSKSQNKGYLITFFFIGFIIVLLISNLILSNIGGWQILSPAELNYVICDIPTGRKIDLQHLKDKTTILQLLYYIIEYPVEFLRLAIVRLKAFFLLIRPYYSGLHNIYLLCLCSLLYVPIIINSLGHFTKKIRNENIYLSILIIIMFCIAVGVQCDDYHNRFHNSIIPVFLYLGIFNVLNK